MLVHAQAVAERATAAEVNGPPVDQITEVSVLDPYFCH